MNMYMQILYMRSILSIRVCISLIENEKYIYSKRWHESTALSVWSSASRHQNVLGHPPAVGSPRLARRGDRRHLLFAP
jgi:hypothetical protein